MTQVTAWLLSLKRNPRRSNAVRIKAVLIDPQARVVVEVELDHADRINDILMIPRGECPEVTSIDLPGHDIPWVSMFHPHELPRSWFLLDGEGFQGTVVITGDEWGECVPLQSTAQGLRNRITWTDDRTDAVEYVGTERREIGKEAA